MNADNEPWNSSLSRVDAEIADSGFSKKKKKKTLSAWTPGEQSSYPDSCQKLLEKKINK